MKEKILIKHCDICGRIIEVKHYFDLLYCKVCFEACQVERLVIHKRRKNHG